MYREQEFVERCQCDAPAIGPCGSCGRARCAAHLERGLCNRCAQAIGRELARGEKRDYWLASAVFTTIAFATAMVHFVPGFFLGIPLAVATYVTRRGRARRRLIAEMGPSLAASKGELLPAPEPGPAPSSSNDGQITGM